MKLVPCKIPVDFNGHSNAGGGGERVLWEAVRAVQKRWPKAICAVYTGDYDMNKTSMLEKVKVYTLRMTREL